METKSYLLRGEADIRLIRELIEHLPYESTVIDFEETIQLRTVRATTQLWQQNDKIVGFAFVDDYNNLRFEINTEFSSAQLENEIIEWGINCVKKRNTDTGANNTLDASFGADNTWQISMLERFGFVHEDLRSLQFTRSLSEPIREYAFPSGFSLRNVAGEHEVESLVALHRAAFGTDNMTVEQRLAIMREPQYEQELDLVAVAPKGELSAFCICGFDDRKENTKSIRAK